MAASTDSADVKRVPIDEGHGDDIIILPDRRKKKTSSKNQLYPQLKATPRLSKNQQRKLKKLKEEKEKKFKSVEVFATLEKYKLAEDAYALLHKSGTRGQRESMREKLRRAMNYARAGLQVPSEVPLLRERTEEVEDVEIDGTMKNSAVNGDNNNELKYFVSQDTDCEDKAHIPDSVTNTGKQTLSDLSSRAEYGVGHFSDKTIGENPNKEIVLSAKKSKRAHMEIETCNFGDVKEERTAFKKKKKRQKDTMVADPDGMEKVINENTRSVSDTSQQLAKIAELSASENEARRDNMNIGRYNSDMVKETKSTSNKKKKRRKDTSTASPDGTINATNRNAMSGSDNAQSTRICETAKAVGYNLDRSPKVVVHVARTEEVENSRQKLPIIMMEQEIMEAIVENPITIICGETGCGKTTQVPQFLYEAGFSSNAVVERSGMIGVTQPRRVAVIATAKRLSHEMNLTLGQEVGFQVRHDKQVGGNTRIKFMTDGILLREVQSDFLLRKYSVIVLDEAHERSLNTDILIGMLSRVLPLRQTLYEEHIKSGKAAVLPLKLVIMSATLRVDEFVANKGLFPCPPPVVQVPARQFPVTVHFSAKTELVDNVGKSYKKVCAIHKNLPPGGVLVFLTGQAEVHYLCKRLEDAFPKKDGKRKTNEASGDDQDNLIHDLDDSQPYELDDEMEREENWDMAEMVNDSSSESELEFSEEEITLDTKHDFHSDWNANVQDGLCLDAIKDAFDAFTGTRKTDETFTSSTLKKDRTPVVAGPLHVLPLYALLPASSQLKVFGAVPEGSRLVVVATNVAETSITIPGIRYVVDCGRAKEKLYERASGIAKYEVGWISKASAAQRAGRAGRTGPGHCYRLYSSAIFNDTFTEFTQPEISRAPIEGLVLLLKCMGIVKVKNFPFLTQPDKTALTEAEQCLHALSALDSNSDLLTPLGRAIALFPIGPRHARMLLTVMQIGCPSDVKEANLLLALAAATVAALSLDSPFVTDRNAEEGSEKQKIEATELGNGTPVSKLPKKVIAYTNYRHPLSDALSIVRALRAYEFSSDPEGFCTVQHMHARILYEMSKLRKQLIHIYITFSKGGDKVGISTNSEMNVADVEVEWKAAIGDDNISKKHEQVLRQAICAGWADRLARKVSVQDLIRSTDDKGEQRKHKGTQYQACSTQERVYIHPSSSLRKSAPEFVVYNELISTSRLYMKMVTSVDAQWPVMHANALCTFSKPLSDPPPWYDPFSDDIYCWVSPSFGPHLWQLPLHKFPLKSKKHRVAVFACALLQGKVCPVLVELCPHLAADPATLLLPASNTQKRVSELLHLLEVSSIDSRYKLKIMWDIQPDFLFEEILLWVQKKSHLQLKMIWEVLKSEVQKSAKELFPKKKKK